MDTKQVIVIRKDLRMRRGKEIAQGAHAAMKFLTSRLNRLTDPVGSDLGIHVTILTPVEMEWLQTGFRKICLIVNSEEELLEIVQKARDAGLVTELIQDAGHTEFHGEPTYTAAAIGPDYDEKIDPVTGHL